MAVITNAEFDRLLKAEIELERLQLRQIMEPFVEAFKEALGTLAAHTPREQWPKEFETAFQHVAQQQPVAAHYYAELLPTKDKGC